MLKFKGWLFWECPGPRELPGIKTAAVSFLIIFYIVIPGGDTMGITVKKIILDGYPSGTRRVSH
jgi:hypothetical protein